MTVTRSVARSPDRWGRRIEELLAEFGQPLALEVARLLTESGLPSAGSATIELQALRHKHRVYRLRAAADDWAASVIIKRLDYAAAHRNQLVSRRWLPWLGLPQIAPALLGTAAAPGVEWVWAVYEDAGNATLHAYRSDTDRVTAAAELLAVLHTRAGDHPLVAECRREGHDLGIRFFTQSVTDALSLLDALTRGVTRLSPEQAALRDRLRERLGRLLQDEPRRARVMAEAGGPATMLHGDPWTTNILFDGPGQSGIRLIDWDRVGAGSFSYDLSILLYRFAAQDRAWILERYRGAVARAGWRLAPASELNVLFDTAECARYAYRMSWPASAILENGAEWGFAELTEIDRWFEALQPAIPV